MHSIIILYIRNLYCKQKLSKFSESQFKIETEYFSTFFHFPIFPPRLCQQVSQAAAAAASSAVGGDVRHHLGQHNGGGTSGMPGHHTNQQMSQQDTLTPDLGKYATRIAHGALQFVYVIPRRVKLYIISIRESF